MRRFCSYGGLSVQTDLELIGLVDRVAVAAPDLLVVCADLRSEVVDWVVAPTNSWWSEADDDAGRWWLRVEGQAVICVSEFGRRVSVDVMRGADPRFVSHLLVDFVLPVCLDLFGRLVVHATAVEIGASAIAFAAPTGAGKSTIAIATARRAGALLADDALVIIVRGGECWVEPTATTTRLRSDMVAVLFGDLPTGPPMTMTGKHCIELVTSNVRIAEKATPLRSLIVLAPDRPGPATLREVEGAAAVGVMLGNLFHRGSTTQHAITLMERVIALVTGTSVYELAYERNLADLDALVETVIATV